MIKAKVDGQFEFNDLLSSKIDILKIDETHFHILKDNQSYHAEVIHSDPINKLFVIKVNGQTHNVRLSDVFDQLVKKMGLSQRASQKFDKVIAPMPGMVLSISIQPGDQVSKGDNLLILEAMKMENVLKAAGDGVIKTVVVQQGDAVDKGQLLIELE